MQIKRQLTPYMHQSLASVLFPAYRRRVLGLLLLRPEEALHGREIARRTGLPAGTITCELTKLFAQDLRVGGRPCPGAGSGRALASSGVRVRLGGAEPRDGWQRYRQDAGGRPRRRCP